MNRAADWLDSRARLTPAKQAAYEVSTGLRLTYAELNRRANRLAAHLQKIGAGPGQRIALLAPNSLAYLEMLFAAAKTGAVFVPLTYRFSHSELVYVLEDCTPQLLVVQEPYIGAAEGLLQDAAVPHVLRPDD